MAKRIFAVQGVTGVRIGEAQKWVATQHFILLCFKVKRMVKGVLPWVWFEA